MTTFATVDPTTGESLQGFTTLSDEGVQRALEASGAAYDGWSRISVADRANVLRSLAGLYRQHSVELAKLTTLEVGKPITQALGEVELAASIYLYYADQGPDLLADEELSIAGTGRAVVRTAPIGPLLGVMPCFSL